MASLVRLGRHQATSSPSRLAAVDEAEGAVVVGQVPHQPVVRIGCRAGLLELLAQHLRGRDVGGVGDRHAARPDPVVGGDQPSFVADLDPGQVGGDVDEPADHRGVDGVVAAVDADVVVASQPDPVDPPDRRRDRRQRQHRRPVGVEQVDRAGP